ncbi:MAG: transporter substrate-binding domain-containing protein [Clostridia bacterium]|nr:transporter substrate-binding domain-containing protein [Clostridia bacterium]
MKRIFALAVCVIMSLCVLTSCSSSKTYVIATDNQMQPFCFVDGQGDPIGFDIDIINAVAENTGISIELRPMSLLDGMEALESGRVDGLMAALIPSEEMMQRFDFSDMYFNNEYAFAVKKGRNNKLIEKFNEGLSNITESGKYKEIYVKHFGEGVDYFG